MRLGDVAKAVGETPADVAAELGLEKDHHLSNVDDTVAQAYIEAKQVDELVEVAKKTEAEQADPPAELKSGRVRFWCESERKFVPGDGKRGDILFHDWVYECDENSEECKLLRQPDVQARARVFEVLDKPYADPMDVAAFVNHLHRIIHPSPHEPTVPSRQGRDCVKALLPQAVASSLKSAVKNVPKALVQEVARVVSLKNQVFDLTGE